MTRTLSWVMAIVGAITVLLAILILSASPPRAPLPAATGSSATEPERVGMTAAAKLIIPTRGSGNYSSHCTEEWTKRGVLNNEMYRYCIEQEESGYDKLISELGQYKDKDLPWLAGVVNTAVTKWTKRGSRQDSMVAYEVHRQLDAFLNIAYASKNRSEKMLNRWSRL
jgi:hypothetical protein